DERSWIEIVEAEQGAGRSKHRSRNIAGVQVRRRGMDSTAGDVGIKRGCRMEAHLNRQAESAGTDVANFDARIAEQFVLYPQRPGHHLRRNMVWDQVCCCCARRGLGSWRHIFLQQSAAGEKTLAGCAPGRRSSGTAGDGGTLLRL